MGRGKSANEPRSELASGRFRWSDCRLGQLAQSGDKEREGCAPRGCNVQGVRNLCWEGGEVEGGEVRGGEVSVTAKAVREGVKFAADVLRREADGMREQGTGEKAGEGEVRLGFDG